MKNDHWRKTAKDLGLNLNALSRDGFTERGQLNVMNNMQAYLPIDGSVSRDAGSLLVEMAFSARAYERRNGYPGKYIQSWLAEKIDSYRSGVAALASEAPAPDWAELGPKLAKALFGAQKALRRALPHCPADGEHNGDSVFVGEWLDEVNEALSLLPAA